MNYRHAFHAGNFADVFKHTVLARVIAHLAQKEAPFFVLDTHAGSGRYDLTGEEADRTGEWRDGIGRLLTRLPQGSVSDLLKPYFAAIGAAPGRALAVYPGSPLVALALARAQDRLVCCELHPEEREALRVAIGGDRRARIADSDGWTALKAQLPPPERRGLVLIDPPFEDGDDFRRFETGLREAHRRWSTGIFLFWYPVKDRPAVDAFTRRIARLGIPKILRAELAVSELPAEKLAASGLLLVNPPWKLDDELRRLLPWLAATLGRDDTGKYRLDWLAAETPRS